MCCNHLGMMGGQIAHCGTMVLMLILYNVIILRSLMYNSVNNIKVCHTPPPKKHCNGKYRIPINEFYLLVFILAP